VKYASKDKTVEVSGGTRDGKAIGPISFKSGSYTTSKADEIELLDALATDPDNPIGFDPKEE
jgi:hypothetical protein